MKNIQLINFRWKSQVGIFPDFEQITVKKSSPIGISISEEIEKEYLSCNWVKLTNIENLSSKII